MLEQCANDGRAESEEYKRFVEKFEPKKTTDDCYTPDNIYDVVADYVSEYYKKDRSKFVRPFYPGGDYENYNYPDDCVVVDNPPFSILSKIVKFYNDKNIDYFIFVPGLTSFNIPAQIVCTNIKITYANKVVVNTSFATNIDKCIVRSAPLLYKKLKEVNNANIGNIGKVAQKNIYPANILTSSMVERYSREGVEFELLPEECKNVKKLDSGFCFFGNAYIISNNAKARKDIAENVVEERNAKKIKKVCLSESEMEIVYQLK